LAVFFWSQFVERRLNFLFCQKRIVLAESDNLRFAVLNACGRRRVSKDKLMPPAVRIQQTE
jgi:hypothetical protein